MEFWHGKIIDKLAANEVFVFGSNPQGIHGSGAAKAALAFGAKFGTGRGLMGQSYGLVTKNLNEGITEKSTGITYSKSGYRSLTKQQITDNIKELYDFARNNTDKRFLISFQHEVWPNGSPKKSLNGYSSEEMFQMFISHEIPENIIFNSSFTDKFKQNKAVYRL